MNRQMDVLTQRQTDRETGGQAERQTDGLTDRQMDGLSTDRSDSQTREKRWSCADFQGNNIMLQLVTSTHKHCIRLTVEINIFTYDRCMFLIILIR